jgi:hypothetical protein
MAISTGDKKITTKNTKGGKKKGFLDEWKPRLGSFLNNLRIMAYTAIFLGLYLIGPMWGFAFIFFILLHELSDIESYSIEQSEKKEDDTSWITTFPRRKGF